MKSFCIAASFARSHFHPPSRLNKKTPQRPRPNPPPKQVEKKSPPADFSQEPFVIEKYYTTARFENDGTGEHDLTAHIRVQSDAGVQQLGELVFGYNFRPMSKWMCAPCACANPTAR